MYRILTGGEPLPAQNYTFRERPGIDIVWRGGDLMFAWGGNWFDPPYFKHVYWFWIPWRILPFIRWRIGQTVGYLGAKAWGVDSEHYMNWLPKDKVRVGSVALVLTARIDADDH